MQSCAVSQKNAVAAASTHPTAAMRHRARIGDDEGVLERGA